MSNRSLTILLTLKGRPRFTFRWLDYMSRVNCPYPILISDGGDDPEVEAALSRPDSYPNLDYTYLRFPYDETHSQFYAKLEKSIAAIDTPYTLFVDNDDFLLMDNIQSGLHFLEGHGDYASCGGPLVLLTVHKGQALSMDEYLYGDNVSLRRAAFGQSVEAEDAADRMRSALDGFVEYGLWYDIHSTAAVSEFAGILAALDFEKYIFAEFLLAAVLARHGKIKRRAVSHYVRQQSTSMGAYADGPGGADYFHISVLPSWGRMTTSFVDTVSSLVDFATAEERERFADGLRSGLAQALSLAYRSSLAMPPRYRALADKYGLRGTALWRAMRNVYLKALSGSKRLDPFGQRRRQTKALVAAHQSLLGVLDFLGQKADA